MTASARRSGVKQPQDHKPSLKDRLRAKRAHTVTYALPETDEARALLGDLERLRMHNELVRMPSSKATDEVRKKLSTELRAVERKFDSSDEFIRVELRGLSPSEWSDLQDEFTAPELTDEEKSAGAEEPKFDRDSFTAALLSIAAFEADMTPDEWAEEFASGRWSRQEVDALRNAALQATNGQSPSAGIPKG